MNVFQRDLSINRHNTNTYIANVGKSQRYGGYLHGGFAASLITHTALEHVKRSLARAGEHHIVSLQVQYLKPVGPEEIELQVEDLSVGKRTIKLHVNLRQRKQISIIGDVTLVTADSNTGITIDTSYSLTPAPTPADLSKLESDSDPKWILYHPPYNPASQSIPLSHWDIHLMLDGPLHPRIYDSWMTLSEPADRLTTLSLPTLADCYLRAVDNWDADSDFSYAACVERAKRSVNGSVRQEDLNVATVAHWMATASLQLEIVRQLPAEGVKWLFIRAEGKVIQNGRLTTEVTIVDEAGDIVALGRVTDVIVPATKRWSEKGKAKGDSLSFTKAGGVRLHKI